MLYFLYFAFIVIHFLLFIFVGYPFSIYQLSFYVLVLAGFHFGFGLGRAASPPNAPAERVIYFLPRAVVVGIVLLYFVLRIPTLLELADALVRGNVQGYLLQNAIDRYAGVETTQLANIGTLLFMLSSGLIGGRIAISVKDVRNLSLIPLYILMIFVQSLDLSRASTVLGLLMFFTFFLFNYRFTLYRLGWRWALGASCVGAGVAFVIFASAQYGRVYSEIDAWQTTLSRAGNLFLGGHYAFLAWFDTADLRTSTYGAGMFGAIAKLFGERFELGNYETISSIDYGVTNIFLWYRGAMEDLGWLFFIYDILCGYSIVAMRNRNPSRIETLLCVFGIQLTLYPFYSPFYFTVFFIPTIMLVFLVPRVTVRGGSSDSVQVGDDAKLQAV